MLYLLIDVSQYFVFKVVGSAVEAHIAYTEFGRLHECCGQHQRPRTFPRHPPNECVQPHNSDECCVIF